MLMFQSRAYVALALALGAARAVDRVELGTAEDYVILAQTGVSTVPDSVVTGSLGLSPISGTAFTGFSLTADTSNAFSKSAQVTGEIYHTDHIPATKSKLNTAVGDMQTAYTDAAGRPNQDKARVNLGGSSGIGGMTLTAGVYTWTVNIEFAADITIRGTADDIFILQTTGNVLAAANVKVILDGSKAENIFWQVAGFVEAGAGAHLEGVFLVKTKADFLTGSSLNGRVLAQTAVNLQQAVVAERPASDSRRLAAPTLTVDLGNAADYAILAKAGVTADSDDSTITGDVGVSPIAGDFIEGFSIDEDSSGKFATSAQVQGKMFAANFISPTPVDLTAAVSNMETAYTDAAGRTTGDATRINLNQGILGGDFGGETDPLTVGVYTWKSDVNVVGDVHIFGSATDIFIMQTTDNLIFKKDVKVILDGGAKRENIFWQVAGEVQANAGAHLEGIFLVKTAVILDPGSVLLGRVLSQTKVTVKSATVTQPTKPERRLLRGGM